MSRGLMLGLEVHAQLQAGRKLFSPTPTKFHAPANSLVSFFDAALPGTQPRLSWDCLRLALRAGVALNARIAEQFSFDRKHYMYPDQPSGYQITQFREPYARHGYLDLAKRDYPQHMQKKAEAQRIRISQIQIEQDTGKTVYVGDTSRVDLNRANTGLIELVTEPDFTTAESAVVFIRKLQQLLRWLGVCSGEMETGAMRVDVNVSVGKLTPRCEIKNLFSTSAVQAAVKAEYARQLACLDRGEPVERETRGWDGHNTWKLRGKESALDYRYMPDPDLPQYIIDPGNIQSVRDALPLLPDVLIDKVLAEPYNVGLVDAKTLLEHDGLVQFYLDAFREFSARGGRNMRMVATWLVHRWIGEQQLQQEQQLSETGDGLSTILPPLDPFVNVLLAVDSGRVSTTTGKLLLKHVAASPDLDLDAMIREYGLETQSQDSSELQTVCEQVVSSHPDVVNRIRAGKKGSISFLLGQVMKETQGTFAPQAVREELTKIIGG